MKRAVSCLVSATLILAFAASVHAAEAPAPALTAATDPSAATASWIPALTDQEQMIFESRQSRPGDSETGGCKAQIYCKSDPDGVPPPPLEVTCSSGTPGTCSSYYGNCGTVVCNGVYTKCPGYCIGDHHCFNYCDGGDFDCVSGCCVCN